MESKDFRTSTANILENIDYEVRQQVSKWGIQHLPDGTERPGDNMAEVIAKCECTVAAEGNSLTWRHIFYEEVREALNSSDPDRLAEELVQVAAVCVSWIRDIEGRKRGL